MVDLVLHAGGQKPLARHLLLDAVAVEIAHLDLGRADHLGIVLGHRQAAFLVGHVLVGGFDDLGVGHQQRAGLDVLAVDVEHDHPLQDADLRRRQADAGRGVHRLQHLVHQATHVVVDRLDRLGLLLEARIGRREDGQKGHGV